VLESSCCAEKTRTTEIVSIALPAVLQASMGRFMETIWTYFGSYQAAEDFFSPVSFQFSLSDSSTNTV